MRQHFVIDEICELNKNKKHLIIFGLDKEQIVYSASSIQFPETEDYLNVHLPVLDEFHDHFLACLVYPPKFNYTTDLSVADYAVALQIIQDGWLDGHTVKDVMIGGPYTMSEGCPVRKEISFRNLCAQAGEWNPHFKTKL